MYETFFLVQVLNIIILVLYRTGYRGGFLGVGGTWNLNEEKNPDAEIVASGVFVGFFIYTTVILISYGFGSNHQKKTLVVSTLWIFVKFSPRTRTICAEGTDRPAKFYDRHERVVQTLSKCVKYFFKISNFEMKAKNVNKSDLISNPSCEEKNI